MAQKYRFEDWSERLAPLSATARSNEQVFQAADPSLAVQRLTVFYENTRNLKEHLKRFAGFEPNTQQASDIAACLRQGREFFRVSTTADLISKPVTLYYGMACYARALALSFANPRRLDQFPARHGLKAPSAFDVPMEKLEVRADGNDGLFHRFTASLAEVSGVATRTRDGHQLWIRLASEYPERLDGFRANLKGLLGRTTGLEDFFQATFDELPLNAPVELNLALIGAEDPGPLAALVFRAPRAADGEWIRHLHPRMERWYLREGAPFGDPERGEVVFENFPPDANPRPSSADDQRRALVPLTGLLVPLTNGAQGDTRLIAAVEGLTVPEPAIELAAAFLLSTVARYRPDLWSSFSSFSPRDPNSRLRALIDAFIERALTVYPLQVLAALTRGRIVLWNGGPILWA